MRFKNFSQEPILYDGKSQAWTHPEHKGSFIRIDERKFVEPGEVTTDFDPEDPIVQLMLKAHPDLRPYVTPTVWERLRLRLF